MKAATGNAMLINIMIVFIVIVLALIVTSISYTKAYRVKNRIVDIIEKHNGNFSSDEITNEINDNLKKIGYRYNTGQYTCPTGTNRSPLTPNQTGITFSEETYHGNDYLYCIYAYSTNRGKYYKVIAYMYFDIPVVGNYINIPVYGETKVFYEAVR